MKPFEKKVYRNYKRGEAPQYLRTEFYIFGKRVFSTAIFNRLKFRPNFGKWFRGVLANDEKKWDATNGKWRTDFYLFGFIRISKFEIASYPNGNSYRLKKTYSIGIK